MQFLFPGFLAALAALAIPIIIHLFYFRRFKKVYFTNVRFLKEVKEETSNRRKLRNLLVLLMRCLAIAMMVLAFCQPFIPNGAQVKKGEKSVSVFVDNSFSMNALSKDANLLELAKKRAKDIVSAYAPDDRFQIVTNDFEGRDQRLVSKDDALNRIEEIRVSAATKELSKVLTRQQQCLNTGKAEHKTAFLVTDFQKNRADLDNFKDTLIEVNLVPMRAVNEKNISIDSAWFESPVQILNEKSRLLIKVSNRSDENADDIRLSLRHDNQLKPVGSMSIAAKSTKIDTVNITILHGGWHEAQLSITDFPVQFDDDLYLAFYVAERINVLSINGLGTNKFLHNVYAGAKYFKMDDADLRNLNYANFANYQMIILNEATVVSSGLAAELKTFAQNGGNVLVFPSPSADVNSYNTLMQAFEAGNLGSYEKTPRQAAQLNTEDFVFRDVYFNKNSNLRLPTSQGNFKLPVGRGEHLLSYRDGGAMLAKYQLGEGAMYFNAASLSETESDLVRNAEIFVPMLFKIAVAGAKGKQLAYTIGKDEVLEAKHQIAASGEMIYKLKSTANTQEGVQSSSEFIPEQRIIGSKLILTPGTQVQEAGWYKLQLKGDTTLAEYAFNYDRKESQLEYYDDETLRTAAPQRMKIMSANDNTNLAQVVGEQNCVVALVCDVCFVVLGFGGAVFEVVEGLGSLAIFRI
jgi:hypothetical protein